MNKIKQLTLSDPIYNRLVQRRNLRTPFVHSIVTRNTGRLLVQLQQLVHLINSSVDRTTIHKQCF